MRLDKNKNAGFVTSGFGAFPKLFKKINAPNPPNTLNPPNDPAHELVGLERALNPPKVRIVLDFSGIGAFSGKSGYE